MSDFFQGIAPLLITLAPIVLPVLFAYLTAAVRSFFEKLPTAQRATLAAIVQTGVGAAEQTGFGKLNGAEKKLVAMQAIHAQLNHFHLNVPDSVLDPMLEEAVLIFNIAYGQKNAAPSPSPMPIIPVKSPLTTKDHE